MHGGVVPNVKLLLKYITEITNHQVELVELGDPQVMRRFLAMALTGQPPEQLGTENLAHVMLRAGQGLKEHADAFLKRGRIADAILPIAFALHSQNILGRIQNILQKACTEISRHVPAVTFEAAAAAMPRVSARGRKVLIPMMVLDGHPPVADGD